MSFVSIEKAENIVILTLSRGKVNALNEAMVEQIHECLVNLEKDEEVRAIILTGQGKFFSFGFDIPEFLSYTKESFLDYLTKFSNLYTYMFLFPKPIVAALNGHTVAGGCMLATACDYRIMVPQKARIALNEITFGSSVFAGSVEILRFCVGSKNAEAILYSGAMYSAEDASKLGLIDQISENVLEAARDVAGSFAQKDSAAFKDIKRLLRGPVAEEIARRERDSIREFVDIWYSESTWSKLKEIQIR